MRARYSAYARGVASFIVATTAADGPVFESNREAWLQSIAEFCEGTVFRGLDVRESELHGDEAFVTFEAHLARDGEDVGFVERSRFVRRSGAWFYWGPAPLG